MALSVGTRIGVYEIVALLGAGGMGEVYRARDTKLGRDVALKIVLPRFTADADRVARFKREARLLASLNHPHIGAIYGFEDTGNVPALVLELVEGDRLDYRVRRGPLPLSEALAVAQQIADALDAAHGAAIIHRDLKPSNIKITPDGVVKVLDFGLAKALAAEGSAPDLSKSPTMTPGGTIEGAILGTAAYMSPEQARGQPVDKRTDIWAFGCVIFEMLTGSSAFARETVTDTIAAVVGAEPEWKLLPAETPGSIRRLLTRCLQKDARRRLHDIADARIELEDAMATPVEPAPLPTPRRWSRLALSEGRRSHRRRILASYVSRIFPASRSLRPFHQTAGRWRSPPAWAANDTSSCSSLLAVRRCKSPAIQSITSALVGRPTRARSCISRRRHQEPSRGASGRSRRLAACHGGSSTAWEVPTSARRMGGSRSSGWRRKASSW